MSQISWEDFQKIKLCSGTIVEVKDFPEAKKPAYILKIDFGKETGIKTSSAQITDLFKRILNRETGSGCSKFSSKTDWAGHV